MTSSEQTLAEIASQPDTWRRAIDQAAGAVPGLPGAGERVLFLGCGTSFYVATAAAWLREAAGEGQTDAVIASELPPRLRDYDRVVAVSRSGTSSEVLDAVRRCSGTPVTALLGEQGTPLADLATDVVDLSYADERSVVQTRFPTTVLVLLRARLGEEVSGLPALAADALASELPSPEVDQLVVLGSGWSVGIAAEAALKVRESAGAWAESYAVGEYRHGPISVAGPRTLVWTLGPAGDDLVATVEATGARVEQGGGEPLAELVRLQRFAVSLAERRGRDADRPVHLSRAVVLTA
jgi:glucosamine--fructose-6-phosphate aminotransferase (isomerizing)